MLVSWPTAAEGFSFGTQFGRRGRGHSVDAELPQRTMHGCSGADPLDNLLAKIASLGEIERPGLGCFLGQMPIGNIDAETGCSFEDAQGFDSIDANGRRACHGQGFPDREGVFGGKPEFKSRAKLAVGANQGDRYPARSASMSCKGAKTGVVRGRSHRGLTRPAGPVKPIPVVVSSNG